MPQPASSPTRERDLRAIVADGVFFSVMVGAGETYVPAFALAIGLGEMTAGLLATVPMLLGACLQLVTPFAVRHLGSYRRWVVLCARLQALSFLPLIVGALGGHVGVGWVGVATVSYWAFGMSTGPAWNAWITSLVPTEMRARFFAHRNRFGQAALMGGLLAAGVALELGRRSGLEVPVFAGLFAAALIARLVSAGFLRSQSEREGLARGHRALGPRVVWTRLRDAGSLRVLRYLLAMQVATHVAAPYFTPYMLSHLGLSYAEFMVLTAAAFLARIAVLPKLGRMADRRGFARVLWLGGLGIVPLPLLWLVSDAFAWLLLVQLVAGVSWAAIELATTLSFFEGIREDDRASVLTAFNLANALAIAVGALIGAGLMAWLEVPLSVYACLFGVSSAGRLLAAALLRRAPKPSAAAPGVQLRTLGVRPGGVAVQRPILASLESPRGRAPAHRSSLAEGAAEPGRLPGDATAS
jgi:MFS family permease